MPFELPKNLPTKWRGSLAGVTASQKPDEGRKIGYSVEVSFSVGFHLVLDIACNIRANLPHPSNKPDQTRSRFGNCII
jgi:hypothetical protein